MQNVIWYTPLLLLPGVALLVMSTSARFGQVHGEIHHLMEEEAEKMPRYLAPHLLKRATLFRNALVGLYLAVALLALSSLLGGMVALLVGDAFWIVMVLTCSGILCLLYAAVQLILESVTALRILKEHVDVLGRRDRA